MRASRLAVPWTVVKGKLPFLYHDPPNLRLYYWCLQSLPSAFPQSLSLPRHASRARWAISTCSAAFLCDGQSVTWSHSATFCLAHEFPSAYYAFSACVRRFDIASRASLALHQATMLTRPLAQETSTPESMDSGHQSHHPAAS